MWACLHCILINEHCSGLEERATKVRVMSVSRLEFDFTIDSIDSKQSMLVKSNLGRIAPLSIGAIDLLVTFGVR